MKNPCPAFSKATFDARAEFDGEPPGCSSAWHSGSGGHIRHSGDCRKEATWWHPDDCFSYCDEHVPESDKAAYAKMWAKHPYTRKSEIPGAIPVWVQDR